ncbi:hypothetical protein PMAYCL1PPCAC_22469, partial [Pristionchus mayeri]
FPLPRQLSLFMKAKIDHIEMSKNLPIRIDEANLNQLSSLFHGCFIDKFTLVFDEMCISNLHLVPSFLARLQVKHVEFHLLRRLKDSEDLIPHFMCGKFAECLVKSGVRAVTFSGTNYPTSMPLRPGSAFDFLLVLFNAGITAISVLPDAHLVFLGITIDEFDALLTNLDMLSTRLRLQLKLRESIKGLNDGRRSMDRGFVD